MSSILHIKNSHTKRIIISFFQLLQQQQQVAQAAQTASNSTSAVNGIVSHTVTPNSHLTSSTQLTTVQQSQVPVFISGNIKVIMATIRLKLRYELIQSLRLFG